MLIQQGKLKLSDVLEQYVPSVTNGNKITIQQLLEHGSGVGVVDAADRYSDCLSSQELLRRVRLAKPLFAPGTNDQYSNEGYFLLALIIEKLTGATYEHALQQDILGPLKTKNSGSTCQVLPEGPNAVGNVPGAEARALAPMTANESVEIGPGSIYSNAHDLYIWLHAVDVVPLFQQNRWSYPFGWGQRNYAGRDLIEQSGILEGFNAHIALYPKEHIYCVVLSNIQSGFFNRIPKDLEGVLFDREVSKPPAVQSINPPLALLGEYIGEYATDAIPYHQEIFFDKGKLVMKWGSYPFPRMLIPTSKDTFYFRYEYAVVRFERDEFGKVAGMSWQWGDGQPMKFRKLDPKAERGQQIEKGAGSE